MQLVTATEMSQVPFDAMDFDGVLGLGLRPLALTESLHFLTVLARVGGRPRSSQFGLFLAAGAGVASEESEITFGGYNGERLAGPLQWVPLTRQDLGYWQVEVLSIRIDGTELDLCG